MREEKIKALFPEGVETIIITKNDYDRLYGQMTYENIILQQEIDRLNNIIDTILEFPFFEEECPLNFGFNEKELEQKAQDIFYEDDYCEENCNDNYKKCWLKYFNKLKELKEENNGRKSNS